MENKEQNTQETKTPEVNPVEQFTEKLVKSLDTILESKIEKREAEQKPVHVEAKEMTRDAVYANTFQLMSAISNKNYGRIDKYQKRLAEGGAYGHSVREAGAFSTLTDPEGAVLLPEMVYAQVLDIEKNYGVVNQLALGIPVESGSMKVPNVAGDLDAFATGEGQPIKTRKFNFAKVNLDPQKWGVIVPWTSEISEEAGAKLMPVVMRKIAQAFAKAKDVAGLYGDGSATYNEITGIYNKDNVADTVSATLTPDNLLELQFKIAASLVDRGVYVMHPNTREKIYGLKDGEGRYIYKLPFEAGGVASLWGRPVYFSEAVDNDQASVFYGDFSYLLLGQGRGLTSDLLTEGTIDDVDDSGTINLATQDMKALRVTERFDIEIPYATAFAFITPQS